MNSSLFETVASAIGMLVLALLLILIWGSGCATATRQSVSQADSCHPIDNTNKIYCEKTFHTW